MVEAVISGENVWQCPVCEYVEKKPVEAVQADEEQKQD